MIHISVGDQNRFFCFFKIGDKSFEDLDHLLFITGVSAVNKQHLAVAFDDHRIASAGGLYESDLRAVCDLVCAYAGIEILAL